MLCRLETCLLGPVKATILARPNLEGLSAVSEFVDGQKSLVGRHVLLYSYIPPSEDWHDDVSHLWFVI